VLESRIKIWYGKQVDLSVQFRMDCNYLNEGCHGGWGFIDGIFLNNYYTVSEQCAPYKSDRGECRDYAHCEPVARASEMFYINEHYGSMSEKAIMKELRSKGPTILDFNADQRF
jgi:cathepsin C